jgi:hypothetical protein
MAFSVIPDLREGDLVPVPSRRLDPRTIVDPVRDADDIDERLSGVS